MRAVAKIAINHENSNKQEETMFDSWLSAPSVLRIIQSALVVAVDSSPWMPRASSAPKLAVLAIASLVGSGLASAQPGTIVTVAGNGEFILRDGGPAARRPVRSSILRAAWRWTGRATCTSRTARTTACAGWTRQG